MTSPQPEDTREYANAIWNADTLHDAKKILEQYTDEQVRAARIDENLMHDKHLRLAADEENSYVLYNAMHGVFSTRIQSLTKEEDKTPKAQRPLHDIVNDDEAIKRAVEVSIEDQKSLTSSTKNKDQP